MRIVVAWLFLSASVALTQTQSFLPVLFPPQLKEYLALSDDQVNRINSVREQVSLQQQPKIVRQGVLYSEISIESAKPVPDPAVLGPRYAELEQIRRALDTLQKGLVSQSQAILGADQKTKLLALQQALALYSTACDAVGQNLLTPPAVPSGIIGALGQFPGSIIPANRIGVSYASFLLGGVVQGGCTGSSLGSGFVLTPVASLSTQP